MLSLLCTELDGLEQGPAAAAARLGEAGALIRSCEIRAHDMARVLTVSARPSCAQPSSL